MCLLLDINRKSTTKLHFTLSDLAKEPSLAINVLLLSQNMKSCIVSPTPQSYWTLINLVRSKSRPFKFE